MSRCSKALAWFLVSGVVFLSAGLGFGGNAPAVEKGAKSAVAGQVLAVALGNATEAPLAGADAGVFSGKNLLGSAITDKDGFYFIDEFSFQRSAKAENRLAS